MDILQACYTLVGMTVPEATARAARLGQVLRVSARYDPATNTTDHFVVTCEYKANRVNVVVNIANDHVMEITGFG